LAKFEQKTPGVHKELYHFNSNKYNRHPLLIPIGHAPIPNKEGENLHIDIFTLRI